MARPLGRVPELTCGDLALGASVSVAIPPAHRRFVESPESVDGAGRDRCLGERLLRRARVAGDRLRRRRSSSSSLRFARSPTVAQRAYLIGVERRQRRDPVLLHGLDQLGHPLVVELGARVRLARADLRERRTMLSVAVMTGVTSFGQKRERAVLERGRLGRALEARLLVAAAGGRAGRLRRDRRRPSRPAARPSACR